MGRWLLVRFEIDEMSRRDGLIRNVRLCAGIAGSRNPTLLGLTGSDCASVCVTMQHAKPKVK